MLRFETSGDILTLTHASWRPPLAAAIGLGLLALALEVAAFVLLDRVEVLHLPPAAWVFGLAPLVYLVWKAVLPADRSTTRFDVKARKIEIEQQSQRGECRRRSLGFDDVASLTLGARAAPMFIESRLVLGLKSGEAIVLAAMPAPDRARPAPELHDVARSLAERLRLPLARVDAASRDPDT